MKRGKSKYFTFPVDTQACHLDEWKIASKVCFDGYYVIISNDLDYETSAVYDLYGALEDRGELSGHEDRS